MVKLVSVFNLDIGNRNKINQIMAISQKECNI